MMNFRLKFDTSPEIQNVIDALGRTEDVKFSPDNRRMALVGTATARLLVLDILIESTSDGPKVFLLDYVVITSTALYFPHGISFIDEETIIVADRNKYVTVFKLPPTGTNKKEFDVAPLRTIRGGLLQRVKSPGSVAIYETDSGIFNFLICNNYAHVVTSHVLDMKSRLRVRNNGILLQKGLKIPDGISISTDRKWIAISNHSSGTVFVYANSPALNKDSAPAAILGGIECPHGVRFAADGKYLVVADAAAPFVHIFECDGGDWGGNREPVKSVRVLDDETFLRGRYNQEEGGTKGIDVDSDTRVLVTTCEHQILAFFDMNEMLRQISTIVPEEIEV